MTQAKTPYQRILDRPDVPEATKAHLRQLYQTLNPADLLRQIEARQEALWKLALRPSDATIAQVAVRVRSGEPRFPAPSCRNQSRQLTPAEK